LHLEAEASLLCITLSEEMSHGNPLLSEGKPERFFIISPEINILAKNARLNAKIFLLNLALHL
jgi:hypothetical protein